MNTEDLRSLAGRAETIEGRQTDRLAEVHSRIRTARRRRAGAASACVGGSVLALVLGVSAVTGPREGGREPIEPLTPTPSPMETPMETPTETTEIPDGQETYLADIRPGDIDGWERVGSFTNTQAGFLGDTELLATLTYRAHQHGITPFCRGDADTWYVLSSEDGKNWGRCSPADSFPVAPNLLTLGPYPDAYPAVKGRFRMFVTKPPQDWIDCNRAGHSGCVEPVLPPSQPLDSTDAQFGFVVHEHEPAPTVLEALGASFVALVTTARREEYLVNRAVLAASDASTLVVPLDDPDRASIVAVYTIETPETKLCRERHDTDRTQLADWDRRCVPELELHLNGGQPLRRDGLYGGFPLLATTVPAGTADEVTVDVIKNDPRNVRFAVVIWKARS